MKCGDQGPGHTLLAPGIVNDDPEIGQRRERDKEEFALY